MNKTAKTVMMRVSPVAKRMIKIDAAKKGISMVNFMDMLAVNSRLFFAVSQSGLTKPRKRMSTISLKDN